MGRPDKALQPYRQAAEILTVSRLAEVMRLVLIGCRPLTALAERSAAGQLMAHFGVVWVGALSSVDRPSTRGTADLQLSSARRNGVLREGSRGVEG